MIKIIDRRFYLFSLTWAFYSGDSYFTIISILHTSVLKHSQLYLSAVNITDGLIDIIERSPEIIKFFYWIVILNGWPNLFSCPDHGVRDRYFVTFESDHW